MLIISFYTNQNAYKNRKIQVLLRFLVSLSSILAGTDFARVTSVQFSFSNLNIGYSTLISSTSNLRLDCITEACLDFTSFTNFISCEEISQIMNNLLHSMFERIIDHLLCHWTFCQDAIVCSSEEGYKHTTQRMSR